VLAKVKRVEVSPRVVDRSTRSGSKGEGEGVAVVNGPPAKSWRSAASHSVRPARPGQGQRDAPDRETVLGWPFPRRSNRIIACKVRRSSHLLESAARQ